jgi:hypothetical protein
MQAFSSQAVVDRMVVELGERRRRALERRAAYLALARAVLDDAPALANASSEVDGLVNLTEAA